MNCPSCKKRTLIPTKLAYGLPSFSCNSCGGSLIEILSYRMWCEGNTEKQAKKYQAKEISTTDSKHTLVCPKCDKIMTKFQMSADTTNKIDLCSQCGRFWLDGGEWNLLGNINLENDITSIFNEPWQKLIKKQLSLKSFEDKYRERIGEVDFIKAKNFRNWVNTHSNKKILLEYLTNLDKHS